ncbi:helix-turn-helix domain-containing protein [Phytoactinopolyspora alkaliphila]|uniref:Helix-turn-helix domain-containing protein n=1 Tax=Phytoactinopolyspora alkaliphila TaxID=1783498 RepID=A0A6N9YP31_9ACTN|nr:helix-turn-helix domain-containing protein [Phytoactinopolyspora alkaliphila]NED96707.1 helix-turn-helix domain-containing protein [Phytoactinopolyspora alkaliphila]
MTRKLLTLKETAEILSASHAQVYALVRSGDLPAMKMGGRGQWRIDPDRLSEYIERSHQLTDAWVRQHPMSRATSDDTGAEPQPH